MSLFQKSIDFFYRFPKGKLKTYSRFGGYFAYKRLQKEHQKMILASLKLQPVRSYDNGLPIYFLTGKKYIHQTLFCIQSLNLYTKERFCFYLVDDGSFDEQLIERVKNQLPDAVLIQGQEIEKYINNYLPTEKFPVLNRKRKEYPHIKKLTDIHLFPKGDSYKLVLDSDILFWNNPDEMIDWIKRPLKPIYMLDCQESYGYSKNIMQELSGNKIKSLVNVGVIGLNSSSINWQVLEEWCVTLEKKEGTSYFLEQALSAMLIGEQHSTALDRTFYIVNPKKISSKDILHHYVDTSKKLYFKEAWKKIAYQN